MKRFSWVSYGALNKSQFLDSWQAKNLSGLQVCKIINIDIKIKIIKINVFLKAHILFSLIIMIAAEAKRRKAHLVIICVGFGSFRFDSDHIVLLHLMWWYGRHTHV